MTRLRPHSPLPSARTALSAGLALFTAVSVMILSGGLAQGAVANPGKVTICHGTASSANPYIVNTPDKTADAGGHAAHVGPVWSASLAPGVVWGDIIPEFDYVDNNGAIQHFPGLNWNNTGKAFWYNDCNKPPVLKVTVLKTNNADGVAPFSHSETSLLPGSDVPFQVKVTNNNSVSIDIDSITDAVTAGAGLGPVAFTCSPALVGTTIAPGASKTCAFTVTGYSPADGLSRTNTATVNVHQTGNAFNPGTGSSTSVVTTHVAAVPVPPTLSLQVVKTNNADGNAPYSTNETATAVGADVPFKVEVTNNSSVPVKIDTMTDTVPAGAVPFSCDVALVGQTLAAGASATCLFTATSYSPADGVSKTNTVTLGGHEAAHGLSPEDTNNTVSDFDTSTVTTDVPAPAPKLALGVVKTNNADGVGGYSPTETASGPGQDVPYQVVITNNSPITVALDGLTDVVGAAAAVPVTCVPALPPTLASGASATCLFTLVGSSPAAGSSLTDTVTATAHDPADSKNSTTGQGSSTVLTANPVPGNPGSPDLSIVKTGPASSLLPGQDASYTLAVTNGGNAAASSVVVDDAIPANTTLKSITAAGWTCTGAAVHCVLNTQLAPGGSTSLTVVLTLAANYAASSVSNTATVGPTDATPSDNTSTVTTAVSHAPDLAIVKSGPATVVAGDDITWTLTVTNDGDAPAPSVTVTDTLPAGVTPGTVTAVGWTCTGTASLSCTLDTALAAGATAAITIEATVPAGFTAATVSNTAVVGPTDATPDDNTSTAVTTVTQTSTGGGGVTVPTQGGGTPSAGGGTPTAGGGKPATGGGGGLAFTGVPVQQWTLEGLALLLFGTGLLLMGRRKKATV